MKSVAKPDFLWIQVSFDPVGIAKNGKIQILIKKVPKKQVKVGKNKYFAVTFWYISMILQHEYTIIDIDYKQKVSIVNSIIDCFGIGLDEHFLQTNPSFLL